MRGRNRSLIFVVTALIAAVMVVVALWERGGDFAPWPPALITTSAETAGLRIVEAAVTETAVPETPAPEPSPEPTPEEDRESPLRGKLLLSEIVEKNRASAIDEDGTFPDWIELYNASSGTLELGGCRIADRDKRFGWLFPDVKLAPGDYLLLFASGKDRRGDSLHTNFALSERDCVCLYDSEGYEIDTFPCTGAEADVAFVRREDGSWDESLYPTPGYANTASGYERAQSARRASGPLVISEVAVKNFGFFVTGTSEDSDWVEIRNISDHSVQLSNYYLSDKADQRLLWRLPDETLGPGYCTVFACSENMESYYSVPNTGFELNAAHEQLYLSDSRGRLLDWVSLRDIPVGGSYGRLDGKEGFFFFQRPSPDSENRDGERMVCPTPVSLTPDGVYENAESVMLRLEGSGTLRYTIDGKIPTEESERYTGPIPITETCVVRVKSFALNALPSRTLALTFIMNEGHTLPVACFAADNAQDFESVYNGASKGTELSGTFAFFRGDESLHATCGVKLNGETSLIMHKKNMALNFRNVYGQDTLEYDLFGGGATSFDSLLLRAGQDQYQAVIRNELAQSLVEQTDAAVINQRSLFCILYLNGKYVGIYTLKERPNASLYAAVAGVDPESVECFESPALFGSEFYQDVVSFINENDITDPANYRHLCEIVDMDSLIDWLFLEGFCANTDVTFGNLRYARSPQADGRWHLIFYDLDAAFRSPESVQTNLLNAYGSSRIQVAAFSLPLIQNRTFRAQYLSRAAELLSGPLSNEAILAEMERMVAEIRPEITRDFKKIFKDPSDWDWNLDLIRGMIESDWCMRNIEGITQAFELSEQERAFYFGELEKASAARVSLP